VHKLWLGFDPSEKCEICLRFICAEYDGDKLNAVIFAAAKSGAFGS